MDFISITGDMIASSTAYIGQLVAGAGPLIWVAIGVPFAFYVVRKAIGLIPKR